MNQTIDISVVLYRPAADVLDDFARSLGRAAAALQAARGWDCRVWLIDNGDDLPAENDGALGEKLGSAARLCGVLRGHGNVGYGAGHNLAIGHSTGAYHLISNYDLIFDEDSLIAAVDFMAARPDVGLLTPHMRGLDGRQQFTCKRAPNVFDLALRSAAPRGLKQLFQARLARYEMQDKTQNGPCDEIERATGAFMFFRGEILATLGGFDERFFLHFEDMDLSLRASRLAKIAFVPTVRVVHFGGHAASRGWVHVRFLTISMVKYFSKYGWKWI